MFRKSCPLCPCRLSLNHMHTPLFSQVLSAIRATQTPQLPSRRRFIATAALGAAYTMLPACKLGKNQPKVAIVGGGIAGLNAAWKLKNAGIEATVYEGSNRVGGRIFTGKNVCGEGLYAELGGEFIDSIHTEILALCKEFNLEIKDRMGEEEQNFKPAYWFDGIRYTDEDVINAFKPIGERMQIDIDQMGEEYTAKALSDFDKKLDQKSIAQYLDEIGCNGWIRKLLDVAFTTEYGLEIDQQSAIAMLYLIDPSTSGGFKVFGESDERYKVFGGNEKIIHELKNRLQNQIETGHKLEAISEKNGKYNLNFALNSGQKSIDADIVLMTIPFNLLREMDIKGLNLPAWKQNAIDHLAYGQCGKLLMGLNERPWRKEGFSGETFSDSDFMLGWDNSQFQQSTAGGLSFFLGGNRAIALGQGSPQQQMERLLPQFDAAFKGSKDLFNGKVTRFHWPSYKWTKMAYSACKVGHFSTISGYEFPPIGNLHFAGEHTSLDFQGFMEGGAETGKRAAEAIIARVGK